MDRIPTSPPSIAPVAKGEERPLWSVMIPVYNCISYLSETLESVLTQNHSGKEMQIEVIDDASTDGDVEGLVLQLGKGRIKYFRQPENVGSLRNFETCINRSKGELIHLLHGDDKVRSGYYLKMEELFKSWPQAGAAFCNFINIDERGIKSGNQPMEQKEPGILENWFLTIAKYQRVQYVAITVKREVYEKLGSFYAINYAEDWEMWTRIAKHYPVVYTPEIHAEYRKHSSSISGKKYENAEYLDDLSTAMMLIQPLLPEGEKKNILENSRLFYARYALRIANAVLKSSHNKRAVKNNIRGALKMHKDAYLFYKIFKLYLKMFFY